MYNVQCTAKPIEHWTLLLPTRHSFFSAWFDRRIKKIIILLLFRGFCYCHSENLSIFVIGHWLIPFCMSAALSLWYFSFFNSLRTEATGKKVWNEKLFYIFCREIFYINVHWSVSCYFFWWFSLGKMSNDFSIFIIPPDK